MLGMLAMIYSGVLPFRTAFSNFGSTPVLLTAGIFSMFTNASAESTQYRYTLRIRDDQYDLCGNDRSAGIHP